MNGETDLVALHPPTEVIDGNRWHEAPPEDPLVQYLTTHFGPSVGWQVTRLLGAAYVYRNGANGPRIVAKFYAAKTQITPEIFAERERLATERARRALGEAVVGPLGQWRGVLLLPFVPGLTLESLIAVRRNQAGELGARLAAIAEMLAALHSRTAQPEASPNFSPALESARKFVNHLAAYGPLESDPLLRRALEQQLSRWASRPVMHEFSPVFVHGDSTTGNFIFPSECKTVALDWERAQLADPAHDLGRLAAEVTHSIAQNGGTVAEALPLVEYFTDAYTSALPRGFACDALRARAVFYRAISSLRIARNSWSGARRVALVAQAIALLSAP